MSDPSHKAPQGRRGFVDAFEETVIAVLLGLMTLVTFVNVVLRYGFNDALIWGLEITLILFAWLVLFGMSHLVKHTAHLGVDALINVVPPRTARILGILAALACLAYGLLLLKGAWDYWAPFAGFEQTTGRWFPTGFDEKTRDRAFYITEQVPMPFFLDWLSGAINQGEEYEKLPRVVPYLILPIGVLLYVYRVIEALVAIFRGTRTRLIVSYENEEVDPPAPAKREA